MYYAARNTVGVMRFAFSTAPQLCTWEQVLPVWQAADEVDVFEGGWTFDHFEAIFTGNRADPCMEGWITLTALLAATRRLRGGVLVTGMVYRHPAAVLASYRRMGWLPDVAEVSAAVSDEVGVAPTPARVEALDVDPQ